MDGADKRAWQYDRVVAGAGLTGARNPVGGDGGWCLATHIWSTHYHQECTSSVVSHTYAFSHVCPDARAKRCYDEHAWAKQYSSTDQIANCDSNVDSNSACYLEPDCYPYRRTLNYPFAYADPHVYCTASPTGDCHTSDPYKDSGAQVSLRCCSRGPQGQRR